MADRTLVDQLDKAVQAVLGPGPSDARPEIAPLVAVAVELRHLPTDAFRARLRSTLLRRASMTTATSYVRPGFRTITPYLVVSDAAGLINFLKEAFDAREVLRVPRPGGAIMHAEIDISDSRIELADATEQYSPAKTALHLYVPDADAVYRRAMQAGGTSLQAPVDQAYGDREASVRDPFGNNWYIGTHKLGGPGQHAPKGLRTVTPYLHALGANELIGFLRQAFGAEECGVYRSPKGLILHAKMRIGDSIVELGEAHGEWGPVPGFIHLYVPDADATYASALQAGGTSFSPLADTPYGDRGAGVRDAWGNQWYIATHLGTHSS